MDAPPIEPQGLHNGSSDFTQLVLGVAGDSELVAAEFDERNHSVVRGLEAVAAAELARQALR